MSGPIVRTGTTPKFWKNWDNIFGGQKATEKSEAPKAKAEKKEAKSAKKPAAKKSTKTKAAKKKK